MPPERLDAIRQQARGFLEAMGAGRDAIAFSPLS
jgi:hypothetical protein